MARRLERGEIRLYRFPAPDKERPVVLLTREASLPYLTKLTVAPVTSTVRGAPSEVILEETDGMKGTCAVNLYNLATVHRERLGRRIGKLSSARLRQICSAMRFALGCD